MNKSSTVIVAIIVVVLLMLLAATAYASYTGYGYVATGEPSARSDSVNGVIIIGGGPGSGK
ncbi:MAG: hypothetical protein KJ043_04840 [Anaerolineae bacterium]|nr:hypothetical protein [Anaerolineae bacterium]